MLSIDSGNHFIITNTKNCEGTIYTSGIPTDRELNSVINLTIEASDRGSPTRTVCVYINVATYLHNTYIMIEYYYSGYYTIGY